MCDLSVTLLPFGMWTISPGPAVTVPASLEHKHHIVDRDLLVDALVGSVAVIANRDGSAMALIGDVAGEYVCLLTG